MEDANHASLGPVDPAILNFVLRYLVQRQPLIKCSLQSECFNFSDVDRYNDKTWGEEIKDQTCFICQETVASNGTCLTGGCGCGQPLHAECLVAQVAHGEKEKSVSGCSARSRFVVLCVCQSPFLGKVHQQYLEEAYTLWSAHYRARHSERSPWYEVTLPRIVALAEDVVKHVYKNWSTTSCFNPLLASAFDLLGACYMECSTKYEPRGEYVQRAMFSYLVAMHEAGPTSCFRLCGAATLIKYIETILLEHPNHPELKRIVPVVIKYLCTTFIHLDDTWQPQLRKQVHAQFRKIFRMVAQHKRFEFVHLATVCIEIVWKKRGEKSLKQMLPFPTFRVELLRIGNGHMSGEFRVALEHVVNQKG